MGVLIAGMFIGSALTFAALITAALIGMHREDARKAEAEARQCVAQAEQCRQVVEEAEQILRRRDA